MAYDAVCFPFPPGDPQPPKPPLNACHVSHVNVIVRRHVAQGAWHVAGLYICHIGAQSYLFHWRWLIDVASTQRKTSRRRDSLIDLIWKLPGIIELTYARVEPRHFPCHAPSSGRPFRWEGLYVVASHYQKRIRHDWLHWAIMICLPLSSAAEYTGKLIHQNWFKTRT